MDTKAVLKIGLPKGRMQAEVFKLMEESGLGVNSESRGYRPRIGQDGDTKENSTVYEAKILKPQNIVEMLDSGTRDIGFVGADWVAELNCKAVEVLNTHFNPVKIVVAAPEKLLQDGKIDKTKKYILTSEYENISKRWIEKNISGSTFIKSYGATEVFPPEDADLIIDNCASGNTLKANGLIIVDEIMTSSTRLYASAKAMENKKTREAIEEMILLLSSVLEAKKRVMLEMNVSMEKLDHLLKALPYMKSPTISTLQGGRDFAVRIAAPKDGLRALIPEIKKRGGTDIIVTELSHLVP